MMPITLITQSLIGYDGTICVYRSTPALGCGVVAALLLLTVLTSSSSSPPAAAGAAGRRRTPRRRRLRRSASAPWPWSSSHGCCWPSPRRTSSTARRRARSGSGGRRRRAAPPKSSATIELHRGVFGTAAVLSLVVVALDVASYVVLHAGTTTGIPMGQPEVTIMGRPAYSGGQPQTGGYHGHGEVQTQPAAPWQEKAFEMTTLS
ncbi:hypothetical protein ACP70R_019768 [Stipagrostis hirtigluma subsp. patula]